MPRNPAGIYTLPNPPVVAGTTILSSEENATRDDMEDALTSSLDRSGRGPMLAPVRTPDGIQTVPSYSFTNETNSGLYRKASGEFWFAVGGVDVLKISASGIDVGSGLTTGGIAVPTGTVLPFASGNIPAGYLICDGTSYATATYPALFTAIGYNHGGSGAFFNVPDLRARVPMGVSPGSLGTGRQSAVVFGGTGGEQTHVLTEAELAAHTHGGVTTGANANHTHSGQTGFESADHTHTQYGSTSTGQIAAGGAVGDMFFTNTSGASNQHYHSFSTSTESNDHAHGIFSSGSGSAHQNLPPFCGLYYIIKT